MSTERTQWGAPSPQLEPPTTAREPEWFEVGEVGFSALGDRVVILEDQFKSGYECKTCNGNGKVACTGCVNGRSRLNPQMKCKLCGGSMAITCPDCQGKGGTIVVPEVSQRRPTTGVIVSAGENCRVLKKGEQVMYSNFAGYAVDLNRAGGQICLRILHETEVLNRVRGHLELRMLKDKSEVSSI